MCWKNTHGSFESPHTLILEARYLGGWALACSSITLLLTVTLWAVLLGTPVDGRPQVIRTREGFRPEGAPPLKEGGSMQSHGVVHEGRQYAGHSTQIEAVTKAPDPPDTWSPSIDGTWPQRSYAGD